ncbi:hypothetical protein PAXINDRAFT_17175 [Paxillus involutus ATCC 200175]|uniref:Uncharacterized protein n=1 Tax=Paxillus involutus ATCC 200175 TaxID=664439 RepID=A0A0C9SQN6_PAXIN|nr:hypothetical protein PAXINDRAFT_17175 [Paxillus involutus ATCC 200175]
MSRDVKRSKGGKESREGRSRGRKHKWGKKAERCKHEQRRRQTPTVSTLRTTRTSHQEHPQNHHHHLTNQNDETSTSTPRTADALHDPGGKMKEPPSVRLEGERDMEMSRYIKLTDVKTNVINAEEDKDDHQPSRNPVGMTDGVSTVPTSPQSPLTRKGSEGEMTVEGVETNASRQVNKSEDDEDKGEMSKEVEDEIGGECEGEDSHQDGRTSDTDDATSSTSCDSLRVETGALADDEASQQSNSHPCHFPSIQTDLHTSQTHHVAADDSSHNLRTSAEPKYTEIRTKSDSRIDNHPDHPNVTETAQSCWGTVPAPPNPRTKGTEAHTSTPYTIDTAHTIDDCELPYRVITPA